MEIGLQFVGRKEKLPFTYENPILGEQKLRFRNFESLVFVNTEVADFIFKHNPTGFVKKVEKPEPEEVSTEITEEEPESVKQKFMCPHCFKRYTDKRWYDKHVSKCKGPAVEDGSAHDAD